MPWSGSRQVSTSRFDQRTLEVPAVVVVVEPRAAGGGQGDHHLAHHVGLLLLDGGVADPHGRRPLVAGQVVEGVLGQVPRAVDGVHDLEVVGVAGHGPQQPVSPEPGLVGVARVDQRLDRQRGVAQPAVAVVPVALAAEVLGQRRRRGGHDAAGLLVGHQAQGEQRAPDDVGVRHVGVAAARPLALVGDRLLDRWVGARRGALVRRDPGHREGQRLAGLDVELVDVAVLVPDREAGAAQDELVRARDRGDRPLAPDVALPAPRG